MGHLQSCPYLPACLICEPPDSGGSHISQAGSDGLVTTYCGASMANAESSKVNNPMLKTHTFVKHDFIAAAECSQTSIDYDTKHCVSCSMHHSMHDMARQQATSQLLTQFPHPTYSLPALSVL